MNREAPTTMAYYMASYSDSDGMGIHIPIPHHMHVLVPENRHDEPSAKVASVCE